MNRKNLTAAVLAGLAGVAGLAGAAQAQQAPAVNLNPDGLGEVLLYPYYTTNDGNTTLITVVNTTGDAKAVKVRFLEGYNSREVLDFNLYMSEYDVWVAALADDDGTPTLLIPDTSCTVPYLYGDFDGKQALLDYAYTGKNTDGGPTDIARASEGYLEMIEMGTMLGNDGRAKKELSSSDPGRMDSATAATHVVKEDDDGNEYVEPADCSILVDNWTAYAGNVSKPDPWSGWWYEDALTNCGNPIVVGENGCGENDGLGSAGPEVASLGANTGGLFGGAAIINVARGTMYSYDAKAVQGFDVSGDGNHFYPGTIHPSLNDGDVDQAIVFTGQGQTATLDYSDSRTVDAVSAVFMHDTLANTFVIEEDINAGTEWVMTLPTKSWYVDTALTGESFTWWEPNPADPGCLDWEDEGDNNPFRAAPNGDYVGGSGPNGDWAPGDDYPAGYLNCDPVKAGAEYALDPFTEAFDGSSCDEVIFEPWDREESPTVLGGVIVPPIVSPAPPAPPGSKAVPFELCYEVNVLRFGDVSVFGTDSDLLYTVEGTPDSGWAQITFLGEDAVGLVGLPVTGFSAEQYTNGYLEGGVLANYGGLFSHKGSVSCPVDQGDGDCMSTAF